MDRGLAFTEQHYTGALVALCLLAALGSAAYVAYYLRGGPRIIDATAYWQEAKVFASGHLTLTPLDPSASSRGRFLYFEPAARSLAVLFPPGYAGLLSLGFRVGAPLLVGPLLAAALVWVTAATTLKLFERKDAALLAALLSATTMALRYHTADTMSHGLAALLVATAIYSCLGHGAASGIVAGLCLGWLVATRPVTGAVLILACLGFGIIRRRSPSWVATCLVGLLPGCAFWLIYQWASTGSMFHATQFAYYAVADGPPGCFRYGFGKGIGCLFEHGSYVEKRLPNGYGLLQAAYVTLLRLRWHCLDLYNFEPLALALIAALPKASRSAETRLLVVCIAGVILGYFPFYFDASYPGGGARLFVDVIPLEHIVVAGWLVHSNWMRHFVPLSLAGFAFHGSFEHLKLRDRDGGRPMFEPRVLAANHVERGLVFVDTDHGFLLAHDPKARNARQGLVLLRQHGDAHDRIAWESLGRPQSYRYHFDPGVRNATAQVTAVAPTELSSLDRFEAESQWPALAVAQGWVRPIYPPNDCTSAKRGLALEPVAGVASATLALHAAQSGPHRIELGLVARASGTQQMKLTIGQTTLEASQNALAHQCLKFSFDRVDLQRGEQQARFDTGPLGIVLDYWQLERRK